MKIKVANLLVLGGIVAGLIVGAAPAEATPPASSQKVIQVKNVQGLMATQSQLSKGNCEIIIADGDYLMPRGLLIAGDNVTIRSASGNREAVTLRGNFKISHVFWVTADHFRVENLSLGEVLNHGIQVHSERDADNTIIRNVRFFDIVEQMLKGSCSEADIYSDDGLVENCLFEFTKGFAYQSYTGGIDIHKGDGWTIRGNTFRNIVSPDGELTEGAIHFYTAGKNSLIENNQIINCDRGIMLGLDNTFHQGSIVRNNTVHVVRDTGIYLCNARDIQVLNNTVYLDSAYPNAIEYRFAGSKDILIQNNLTNARIARRDHAVATVKNNLTSAQAVWFVDARKGDLHLAAARPEVRGRGVDSAEVPADLDGDLRPLGKSDLGADQFVIK